MSVDTLKIGAQLNISMQPSPCHVPPVPTPFFKFQIGFSFVIWTRFFKWRSFFDCQNLLMAITREIIGGS